MLDRLVTNFADKEHAIHAIAPLGYIVLINLRTMTPELLHSTYPQDWQYTYNREGYHKIDPIIQWALSHNIGTVRWSEITANGSKGTLNEVDEQAKKFGLNFGVAMVMTQGDITGNMKKSLFGATNSDREFTESEIAKLKEYFFEIVSDVNGSSELNFDEIQTLTLLGSGLTQEQTAEKLGLTKDAVAKRIVNCRIALNAENTTHAVALAISRGLIHLDSKKTWY